MTLPTLISKHQKMVTVNSLKKEYNVLSNVFERAKADYGDFSGWSLSTVAGNSVVPGSNDINKSLKLFLEIYMLPYLNGEKYCHACPLSSFNYDEGIKKLDGTIRKNCGANDINNIIVLNDGSIVIVSNTNFSGKTDADGNPLLYGYVFMIDINGAKRPNTLGKDVFFMLLPLATNGRLMMWMPTEIKLPGPTLNIVKYTREELLNVCKGVGAYCGALIQEDGWQIKDDYPW